MVPVQGSIWVGDLQQQEIYTYVCIYTGQAYIRSSVGTVATAAAVVGVEKFDGGRIGK